MKICHSIWGIAVAGCAMGVSLPLNALAAVSDEDFNALKKPVAKQGQKIEELEKTHRQDQQQIRQLQQQLGQTRTVATHAAQKVETLSQIQPIHPIPHPAAGATHNFMIVGEAESPLSPFQMTKILLAERMKIAVTQGIQCFARQSEFFREPFEDGGRPGRFGFARRQRIETPAFPFVIERQSPILAAGSPHKK